jgi:hypothetical protein
VIRTVAGRGNQYDILRAESEAPAVMAALRAYDPALLVGWDSSACRWSLLRVSRGGYHFIGVVETEEHEYRPLDMSILEDLARWDLWKGAKDAHDAMRRIEQEEEEHEAKVARDFRDDLRHATRDNRRTLRRVANLVGL